MVVSDQMIDWVHQPITWYSPLCGRVFIYLSILDLSAHLMSHTPGKSASHTGADDWVFIGSFWTAMEVSGTELLPFAIQMTTDRYASTESPQLCSRHLALKRLVCVRR